MHILIMCISSRRAGFDGMGQHMQSAMVALTLNKPYNFSKYVFDSMKDNIAASAKRFILFPRFVQLMLNATMPNLQPDGHPMALTHMNKRILADFGQSGKAAAPLSVPLFGHIIDAAYVEPANDHWQEPVPAAQEAEPQA